MSQLSPGPGKTCLAVLLNSCLSPSLSVSLPSCSSAIPPGPILPSDSSPVSSAQLQLGKKLPRTKNGAVTWHSTAEEQLPSSLSETSPQPAPSSLHPSAPLPPAPFLLHSIWPLQGHTERHREPQSVCERNRVDEPSIRMRAVLDSPKHTNKPVCWRVWHTLTWPYGQEFMCSLTNCSSKVSLHLLSAWQRISIRIKSGLPSESYLECLY